MTTNDVALRKALASTPRPPRASAASAALTFGWRGMLKVKHVPEQLLDVTITPVMFVVMFTYLFGGAIAGSTGAYLDYILPGILVMSVLFTTVYSGVALNTDLTKGVVDRFRSLPIWRPAPLVGALLGDSVRYLVAGTVIVVLGVILGFRPDAGVPGVVAALALTIVFAFGLSWVFTTLGLLLRSPNAVMNAGFMGDLPADLPQQRVRRSRDAPERARGVRQRQPDLDPGRRVARADGRQRRGGRHPDLARHGRRADRRVHAAHDEALPQPELMANTYTLNERAVERARELIEARQYVLDSEWGELQPRAAEENAFLESHSWEEYAAWHLGLTDGATDETKARYGFVYGDFRRVHRSGIIACHYRAAEWRHKEIELAAHELLQVLDAASA